MYLSYTVGTKQKDCPHNNWEVHPYEGIIRTRQRKVGLQMLNYVTVAILADNIASMQSEYGP